MTELIAEKAKRFAEMMKSESFASRLFARGPRSIERAARAMLALAGTPESGASERLVRAAEAIGMHPASTAEGVRNLFSPMTAAALTALRDAALNPIGRAIPRAPRLVFHLAAGNLFISILESLIHAQLLGCANIVRCSSEEREFTALWLEVLQEHDPEMANASAWAWWPHEKIEVTRSVATEADVVVAFGGDDAVAMVANVVPPGKRFIGHGSRWSYALLSAGDLSSETIARERSAALAYDLAAYDQQGCLSPTSIFLPSRAEVTPQQFSQVLAESLRDLEQKLPRRKAPLTALASQARWRDELVLHGALADETSSVVQSRPEDNFLITLRDVRFPTTASPPSDRTADIFVYDHVKEIETALGHHRGRVGCVGAGDPSEWQTLSNVLGAPRLCELGFMQRPPLGWAHDGRPPLLDLLSYRSD